MRPLPCLLELAPGVARPRRPSGDGALPAGRCVPPLVTALLLLGAACVDALGAGVEAPPPEGQSCTDSGDCTDHERCDESFRCIACLPKTCEQEGRTCGSFVDDCLREHPCGPGCTATESCSSSGQCVLTDEGLCASYSACGPVRLEDRSLVCPDCPTGSVCLPFEGYSTCCPPACEGRLPGEDDGCGGPCPAAWRPGPAQGPSPRYAPAMVFHQGEGRTFLFGGQDSTAEGPYATLADLWSLAPDGSWTLEAPVGELPGARAGARAAVTSPGGELVLFGGWDGWSSTSGDQCTYDDLFLLRREGAALTWRRFDPGAAPHPLPRRAAALSATDDGRIFLSGGVIAQPSSPSRCDPGRLVASTRYADLWSWDGAGWTEHRPQGPAPSGRAAHGLVFDPERRRLILFGGDGDDGPLDDSWEYDLDLETWEELHPPTSPPPVGQAVMVQLAGRTILFGGSSGNRRSLARTWSFDGLTWSELVWDAALPQPQQRVEPGAAVFSPDALVLFGGNCLGSCPPGVVNLYGDSWILELP